ncbi:MAG: hypothetical protein BGO12_03815 [Verrucomicrobia bacterium 61-8]|nr:GntR family transcriptional regulator [Verrucomicrobiota bacterium]OJV23830.1 MAG: hypothetical protein BGO12_03815 [Verrucomicrobia bacterium 61-8]
MKAKRHIIQSALGRQDHAGKENNELKRAALDRVPEARRYQALATYRKILRLIHENDLSIGDRLPPQADLMEILKGCQGTISEAMKWLVADGILTRRQKAGTYITSLLPCNPLRRVWTVGIVTPSLQASPFYSVLAHCLHRQLSLRNCTDRTYMLSPSAPNGEEVDTRSLSDFSGLGDDVNGGLVDGIVTATRLLSNDIPVCGVAGWNSPDFGVIIDEKEFILNASTELIAQGARHIGIVTKCRLNSEYRHVLEGWKAASRAFPDCHFESEATHIGSNGIGGGVLVADELLRRPTSKRPSGLIIPDDMMAQGLTYRLRESGSYRPFCAVQTRQQTPSLFSLPVTAFEVDVEELAIRAVDLLIRKMINPFYPAGVYRCAPKLRPNSLLHDLLHSSK